MSLPSHPISIITPETGVLTFVSVFCAHVTNPYQSELGTWLDFHGLVDAKFLRCLWRRHVRDDQGTKSGLHLALPPVKRQMLTRLETSNFPKPHDQSGSASQTLPFIPKRWRRGPRATKSATRSSLLHFRSFSCLASWVPTGITAIQATIAAAPRNARAGARSVERSAEITRKCRDVFRVDSGGRARSIAVLSAR